MLDQSEGREAPYPMTPGDTFIVADRAAERRSNPITPTRNAAGVAVWDVMRKRLPMELVTTDLLNELLDAAEIR